MGNRAVIAFQDPALPAVEPGTVGIYLHWNGGPESIDGFMAAANELGIPTGQAGTARLCQMIGTWFGGTSSLYLDTCNRLDTDNGDNGTYIVDMRTPRWAVARRFHEPQSRRYSDEYRDGVRSEVVKANREVFAG